MKETITGRLFHILLRRKCCLLCIGWTWKSGMVIFALGFTIRFLCDPRKATCTFLCTKFPLSGKSVLQHICGILRAHRLKFDVCKMLLNCWMKIIKKSTKNDYFLRVNHLFTINIPAWAHRVMILYNCEQPNYPVYEK